MKSYKYKKYKNYVCYKIIGGLKYLGLKFYDYMMFDSLNGVIFSEYNYIISTV